MITFTRCRRFSLAILGIALLGAPAAFGYSVSGTTYTTTGALTDVNAAIQAAPSGAVIKIPAGTFTWGTGGAAVYVSKALTLIGAGPTSTIIDLAPTGPGGTSGAIQIYAGATIEGFTINADQTNAVAFSTGNAATGWRISNITYNSGSDSSYLCFVSQGYGLIDSCNITSTNGSDELVFVYGLPNSWQTADSMGSSNAVFIEDCTFNGPGYVCDANANARVVVRFCTINGQMKIDAHGYASNTPRGVRQIEVYDNTWTYNNGGAFWEMELRGGTGMVFDNSSSMNTGYAWYSLTDYGYQAEWPNFGVAISSATPGPGSLTTISTGTMPDAIGPNWSIHIATGSINGDFVVTPTNAETFTIPDVTTSGSTGGYTAVYQTPVNYPIHDQIGVGMDQGGVSGDWATGGSDPLYTWHNKQNGTNWPRSLKTVASGALALYAIQFPSITSPLTASGTFTEDDLIKENRDIFVGDSTTDLTGTGAFNGSSGVGRGTTAQMNAVHPTLAGVGFWVTDQGTWNTAAGGTNGELFVWNGTAWVLHYTPYTYPHPLRGPVGPTNLILSAP